MNKNNRTLVAQLETMYPQMKFLFMGVFALTVTISIIFWDKTDQTVIISWALLSTFLVLLRSLFVVYSIRTLCEENVNLHAAIMALGSLVSGIIWGASCFIFLDTQDPASLIVVVTLLLGSVAGALVTLSAYLPAYSFCVLTPLAWVLINQSNENTIWIGGLVVVYLFAMIGYSQTVNRNLKHFISLRFQNEELLDQFKQQRDIAEKANIDKSRYLAATSHDLRQPLHALQLYLGNLEQLQTSEQQKLLVAKSMTASDSLNRLLSALMDVSRLDSGEVEINRHSVDLGLLIESIAPEFQTLAEQENINFFANAPHFHVYTDPILLSRCIRNLACNAFDHAKARNINIQVTTVDNEHIQLSIIDDGVGISLLEQDNVFSEFYQLQNPERDRNKGLGLGLAIVKKLALLLDHPLEMKTDEKQGCTFSLTLALSKLTPLPEVTAQPDIDLSGLFIVMVDDDPDICEGMSYTLKNWGCETLICTSAEELITEFKHLSYHAPDVIIADYRLRDNKTGIDTVRAVRELFSKNIPAIVVSGDTTEAVKKECVELQCDFQQKPISPSALKKAIQSVFNEKV